MSEEMAALLLVAFVVLSAPVWLGYLPHRWMCAAGFHRWVRRTMTQLVRPPGGEWRDPVPMERPFAQCRACDLTSWDTSLAPELPPPPPNPLPWDEGRAAAPEAER